MSCEILLYHCGNKSRKHQYHVFVCVWNSSKTKPLIYILLPFQICLWAFFTICIHSIYIILNMSICICFCFVSTNQMFWWQELTMHFSWVVPQVSYIFFLPHIRFQLIPLYVSHFLGCWHFSSSRQCSLPYTGILLRDVISLLVLVKVLRRKLFWWCHSLQMISEGLFI